MAGDNRPKWLEEVEEILRKQFPRPEVSVQIRKARDLADLCKEVESPSGENAELVSWILKEASKGLRPLAAVYAGYQLGVAYERYQNANRS